ncbi:helix-turn-helix domain-containing protein [Staphylococcus cohnii]
MNIFKHVRKNNGLTLDDLSELMTFSRSYISLVENGKSKPSEKYVDNFITVLNTNEDEKCQINRLINGVDTIFLNKGFLTLEDEKVYFEEKGLVEKTALSKNEKEKVKRYITTLISLRGDVL